MGEAVLIRNDNRRLDNIEKSPHIRKSAFYSFDRGRVYDPCNCAPGLAAGGGIHPVDDGNSDRVGAEWEAECNIQRQGHQLDA